VYLREETTFSTNAYQVKPLTLVLVVADADLTLSSFAMEDSYAFLLLRASIAQGHGRPLLRERPRVSVVNHSLLR
jgi:hypothetical protein